MKIIYGITLIKVSSTKISTRLTQRCLKDLEPCSSIEKRAIRRVLKCEIMRTKDKLKRRDRRLISHGYFLGAIEEGKRERKKRWREDQCRMQRAKRD